MKTKLLVLSEIISVYIMILIVSSFLLPILIHVKPPILNYFCRIILYLIYVMVPILALKIRKVPLSILGFKSKDIQKQILIGLLICIIGISIFVLIPLALGVNKLEVLNFKAQSIGTLLFFFFYDLLVVGFAEEIIFRGYFYGRLEGMFTAKYMPMIIAGILFGLWHFPSTHSIVNVISASIIGIIYGFCRWQIKDCSLLSLSIAHGLNDALIILLSYLLL